MNSVYSGKNWIVFIQGRYEKHLFREEMNSAYWGMKLIVFIQGRNE